MSINADHFMTAMYQSFDGCFQQDDTPCHKDQTTSNQCLEVDNKHLWMSCQYGPKSPKNVFSTLNLL